MLLKPNNEQIADKYWLDCYLYPQLFPFEIFLHRPQHVVLLILFQLLEILNKNSLIVGISRLIKRKFCLQKYPFFILIEICIREYVGDDVVAWVGVPN